MFLRKITVALRVCMPAGQAVCNTGKDAYDREGNADAVTGDVLGGILRQEGKHGDDAANVAEADLPGGSDGAPVVATQVHVEPADDDGHGSVGSTGHQEEGSILQAGVVVYGNENAEASDGNADGKDRNTKSVPQLIGNDCHQQRETEGRRPWWDAVQLRLDGAVPVAFYDTRREVGISVGRDNEPKVHETSHDDLVILEDVSNIVELDGSFDGRPALVDAQAGGHEFLLVL